ncbi:MAG: integration host factor subunit beta [Deltaproteobacteria bacterium]|nr:integration host factor subunit beta [Deltaproteobacteria bacterium]MBW2071834.1 integration host factor subunit beta [Deltaproteobacteria bacterium]
MHKSQLAKALSGKMNMMQKEAKVCVDTVFDSMVNALTAGERIEIRGFGTFKVKQYQPYRGRNPKTGKPVQVAAKNLPYFKMGTELKQRVNKVSSS